MPEPDPCWSSRDDDALRDALLITLETAGHRPLGTPGGRGRWLCWMSMLSTWWYPTRMAPMDGLQLLAEIRRVIRRCRCW